MTTKHIPCTPAANCFIAPISSFRPFCALTTRLGIFRSPKEFRLGCTAGRISALPPGDPTVTVVLTLSVDGESFWLRLRMAVGVSGIVAEVELGCNAGCRLVGDNIFGRGGVAVTAPKARECGEGSEIGCPAEVPALLPEDCRTTVTDRRLLSGSRSATTSTEGVLPESGLTDWIFAGLEDCPLTALQPSLIRLLCRRLILPILRNVSRVLPGPPWLVGAVVDDATDVGRREVSESDGSVADGRIMVLFPKRKSDKAFSSALDTVPSSTFECDSASCSRFEMDGELGEAETPEEWLRSDDRET
jgi:hypothetical protein